MGSSPHFHSHSVSWPNINGAIGRQAVVGGKRREEEKGGRVVRKGMEREEWRIGVGSEPRPL